MGWETHGVIQERRRLVGMRSRTETINPLRSLGHHEIYWDKRWWQWQKCVLSFFPSGIPCSWETFFSTGSSFPVFYPVKNVSFWVERIYQYIAAYRGSSVQEWVESGRPEAGLLVVVGEGRKACRSADFHCVSRERCSQRSQEGRKDPQKQEDIHSPHLTRLIIL